MGERDIFMSTESVWPQLPFQVLIDIFKNLSNRDKFNAAMTCKAWVPLLDVPALFTTGHFLFQSDDVKRALLFARARGKWLRHVYADCFKLPNDDDVPFKPGPCEPPGIELMYQFIASLLHCRNNKLNTISLKNIKFLKTFSDDGKERPKSHLLRIITTLVEAQQQLRELDLTNASLEIDKGSKLLQAASRSCSKTLHKLAIDRFIQLNRQDLTAFKAALYSFENLYELEVGYDFLSDTFLKDLAGTSRCSLRLQVLTVRATYKADVGTSTSREAWQKLTASLPELKVVFFIKPKSRSEESYYDIAPQVILVPSMPLYGLHWATGSFISVENIILCFQYIATNFKSSLHHLDLTSEVRLDNEAIGELFQSLQVCKRLKTFVLGLPCDLKTDERDYQQAISKAMRQHEATYAVTLNGQKVLEVC
ncbi:F-box only protein 39-like isoform X2 [Physella acuta]|uniref:F-box only protein 39-like isoform X1 n=1 Tax=Physella acuta TaxID=109671 RepID=UPI0027DEA5CB|nr:F-box only protein 39-like isoform X1 [Physella acuta]XP_059140898.1 F-box only protein 39-like isoform X2 [Physella acuta]